MVRHACVRVSYADVAPESLGPGDTVLTTGPKLLDAYRL